MTEMMIDVNSSNVTHIIHMQLLHLLQQVAVQFY